MTQTDKKQIKQILTTLKSLSPIMEEALNQVKERKTIVDLMTQLSPLVQPLEDMRDKYEEQFESRSERWQESNRGYELNELVTHLDRAWSALEECVGNLEYTQE